MNGWLKACLAAYWIALSLWIAAVVSAGVAAAAVFTVLPGQALRLQEFPAVDPAEHGRIAAGMVMEPVFAFVDMAQAALSAIVVVALLLQSSVFGVPWRRPAALIRAGCIAMAVVLLAYRIAFIMPGMNRELRAYWSAARAGDVAAAETHRAAFDVLHPAASGIFNATLALLLCAAAASAAALVTGAPARPKSLQTPLLADRRP